MPIYDKKILSIQNYFAISRPFTLDTMESKLIMERTINSASQIPSRKLINIFEQCRKTIWMGGSLPEGYFVNRSKGWKTY